MKKIFTTILLVVLCLGILTGCGESEEKLDYTAEEIVEKLYEGISKDDMPKVANTELDEENLSAFLGLTELDFKEGVASEPVIGSIAYSVVVVKVNDGVDIEKTKQEIKDKVNPAKWICVDAEIVEVLSKDDVIVLVMMDEENDELANKVMDNFKNLK